MEAQTSHIVTFPAFLARGPYDTSVPIEKVPPSGRPSALGTWLSHKMVLLVCFLLTFQNILISRHLSLTIKTPMIWSQPCVWHYNPLICSTMPLLQPDWSSHCCLDTSYAWLPVHICSPYFTFLESLPPQPCLTESSTLLHTSSSSTSPMKHCLTTPVLTDLFHILVLTLFLP